MMDTHGHKSSNPRRACARVTVVALCVCVSVCPSVTALAASASAYTCSQRYSGVCLMLFLDIYVWNFEKNLPFKSYGV